MPGTLILTICHTCITFNTCITGPDTMTTSVRFTPEIEERLDRLAKETGRSKSFYIKQMVEGSIDAVEDCYLADSVLERIRAGKEKVHTSASARLQLDLDN
jgi:RHH-type transcriptional regulator, rel operon repressor / antitoxin RelB